MNDNNPELTKEITVLREEAAALRMISERALKHDRSFVRWITAIIALIGIVGTFYAVVSYQRVDQATSRAERYVDEITGKTRPEDVKIYGYDAQGYKANETVGRVGVVPNSLANKTFYTVHIDFTIFGNIDGPSGKLVGLDVKLTHGALLQFMTAVPSGARDDMAYTRILNGFHTSLNSEIISANGNFNYQVEFSKPFPTCNEAETAAKSLVKKTSDKLGELKTRPAFENIDAPPQYTTFRIRLQYIQNLSCDFWSRSKKKDGAKN